MAQQVRKRVVQLSNLERKELEKIVRSQKASALQVKRARILLLSDVHHADGQRTDESIGKLLGMTRRQIQRIRTKYVLHGLEQTLRRKVRSDRGTPKVFDG